MEQQNNTISVASSPSSKAYISSKLSMRNSKDIFKYSEKKVQVLKSLSRGGVGQFIFRNFKGNSSIGLISVLTMVFSLQYIFPHIGKYLNLNGFNQCHIVSDIFLKSKTKHPFR